MNNPVPQKPNFKAPATWLALWFGCGLMKPAPGTWGTLGGMPLGMLLIALGGWKALLAGAAAVTAAGLWAADRYEKDTQTHDSSAIVIDEVAGLLIALVPAALHYSPLTLVLAFALFRLFDILKPWPVNWCDKKIPGARGVMADDLAAGLYAALCLEGIIRYAGLG